MKTNSLCPALETVVLVQSQRNCTFQAHSRSPKYNSGQTVQKQANQSGLFSRRCQVDLFAIRFNNKLSKFVSQVPDQKAWEVDDLSLSWKNLDACASPLVSILGKVI